ncbi:restriction endonuclease subunit S [uncultured Pelagimonas sp.]|uniref:restriction endonuclease subunit S n=1 Tax=uncultured Pelagimonas sp. TaxID=1618102 RepID=UPI002621B883|nr:restriction endonuclease subunit S [uncultured Pelagimonas sp.]
MSAQRLTFANQSKLENLCEKVTVGHVGTTTKYYRDEGVPFLRTQNVGANGLKLDDLKYITADFHASQKKSHVQSGDILVSRVVTDRVNCGVVPESIGQANCANVLLVRPSAAKLLTSYLHHYLKSSIAQEHLLGQRVGAAQQVVNTKVLRELPIPLPPLEEQKRIAGILDQADALRRLRTRALDKLGTLGQAIFHEMFGDIARNSMDWPIGCIGDLLKEAKYGSSAKANTECKGLPMLRMGNLTYDGQIDLASLKHVELSETDFEKYTTRKGDLLFNRTNSKELVGKTAVVKQEEPLAFAGYLVRGRANERGNTDYISAYLNSSHGKTTLVGMCKNIVGMANINAKEMQKISIAIPPRDLQDQFSVAIDAIAPERKKLLDAIDLQNALFASLQHRAFRGEL